MRNIILFDPVQARADLLPLTFTRPVALIRHGIFTMLEKWQHALPGRYSFDTQDYLSEKFPKTVSDDGVDLFIAANLQPTPQLVEAITSLALGQTLVDSEGNKLAWVTSNEGEKIQFNGEVKAINKVYDIFMTNGDAIRADFAEITKGRTSEPLSSTCTLIGPAENLFIEKGATVEAANINTKNGPVYIGKDAEVMEGANLRGPLAMCEHSVVNMGGKIYGPTTLGPYCKVGGELNNVS